MTKTAHDTGTVCLVFAKASLHDHHRFMLQILPQGKEEKQAAGHIVMATIKNVNRMKTLCKMEQKSKTNSTFN